MPTLPPEETVRKKVRLEVAEHAGMPVNEVEFTMVLADPPLRLDDNLLKFLATKLRAYVKSFTPKSTILTSETRKDKQTVEGLAQLVYKRITTKATKRRIGKRGK